jgi:hypothetical protein
MAGLGRALGTRNRYTGGRRRRRVGGVDAPRKNNKNKD